MKDKVRQHQLMTGTQPNKVVVTTEALETRVSATYSSPLMRRANWLQAKDHEIYDAAPFYRSKLFSTNGYKLLPGGEIEKMFRNEGVL